MSEKIRVFLSYGRDEHVPLARRIYADMEERGFDVWFDEQALRAGDDWMFRIERGLKWMAETPDRGRFVLLMTPHSVRRPGGFCLRELHWALGRNLTTVPVMVVWCDPPVSICHLQHLDMRDCIPVEERESEYKCKIEHLFHALETGEEFLPDEKQTTLKRLLNPVGFAADIASHMSRFTGREWLIKDIDSWLARDDAPAIYWITGNPGVGKTALAAWLCHYQPVAASFLCRHGHRHKSDPRCCVLSIAFQLSDQLPEYQDSLIRLNLKEILNTSTNTQTLFDALIVEPLSGNFSAPDRRMVLLIDALDEATHDGENALASFLAAEYEKLPPWLRVIVTSRPVSPITDLLCAFEPHTLSESDAENKKDLRDYLERELAPYAEGGSVPQDVVDKIVQRSKGVFLYAEWVRRELKSRRLKLSQVDAFPQGLGSVYLQYFQRQFSELTAYETDTRPVLEVIAAAQEPLSMKAIAAALGWSDRHRARKCRRSLDGLFVETDRGIEPFHTSVMEWLTRDDRAGVYWADPQEGHARLAEQGLQECRGGPAAMSNYVMTHLPAHLANVGRWADVEALLSDTATIEAYTREAIPALMAHLRVLLENPDCLARVSAALLDAFCQHTRDGFWQQVRGGLYQVFGDYGHWPQPWRKCVEAHPCYLAMRFLGDTLDMEERYEDAEKVFRRMLESADPTCPGEVATAHIRLAYVLEHLDRPEEALGLAERLIAEPGAEERYGRSYRWAQHHQGICLRRLYRYREAEAVLEESYSKGVGGEGLTTGPLHQLGIIDLELGRLEPAREIFEECRKLRRDASWDRRRAYEPRRLGQVHALAGRFKEARKAFEEALEIATNCGDRRYTRQVRDDIVAFVDVPEFLSRKGAATIMPLAKLPQSVRNNSRLLPWPFRVLDRQKKGYLRVLKDSGARTRDIARFDCVHQRGLWHASVLVVIVDEHDNVLLQQRGEASSHGRWDVSASGHVGVGEDDVVAAIRETAEELGTIVAPDELRRVEKSRRFRKKGGPRRKTKNDGHPDAFTYVYHTDKFNREHLSVFRVLATADHKREIAGDGDRDALRVKWRPWDSVVSEVVTKPERFASGLKQLLHPAVLRKIRG